jgi:hypothetical protein
MLFQFGDALHGDLVASLALEFERKSHDGDCKRSDFLRDLREDRGSPGACAAAHSGGDENHIGTFEQFTDLFDVLGRRFRADFGFAPAPNPFVLRIPMVSVVAARELASAWASVFTAMKFT